MVVTTKPDELDDFPFLGVPCLCTVDETPTWQFQHRRVKYGYRKSHSWYEAFISPFYWHNETVNIWTHYIGAVLIILNVYETWNLAELLPVWNMYGSVTPLLCSAFCHQFYIVSKTVHRYCWLIDFLGILSGMLGLHLSYNYLVFGCSPQMRWFNSIFGVIFGIFATVYCWKKLYYRTTQERLEPKDRFPEFSFMLTSYAFISNCMNLLTTILFAPEYSQNYELMLVCASCYAMHILIGSCLFIFAQGGVPEVFCSPLGLPQHFFDFLGHSHQVWHVVVFLIMHGWIELIFYHYELRSTVICPSQI